MQITIYIQNKPIYLCDALDTHLNKINHRPSTIFLDQLDIHTVKTMLREIALPEIEQGIFVHSNLEELKKQFFKKFKVHVAGGGLVINEQDEILMIFRRGAWDLPKGHQDKGETIESCALREVQEETGLQKLELVKHLTTTYHNYKQSTHKIMKECHWFIMKGSVTEKLIPQTEEDIEAIEWVDSEKLKSYLPKAYPSIRDVIYQYQKH